MSNRFHSKHHRFSHHTAPTNDPRWPDAARDPIASHDSPFLGDFVMQGTLSAIASTTYSSNSGLAGFFDGNVEVTRHLSAGDITFTGDVIRTPSTTITSSGKYLVLKIANEYYGIRLWNLPSIPITTVAGGSITTTSSPPGSFVLGT